MGNGFNFQFGKIFAALVATLLYIGIGQADAQYLFKTLDARDKLNSSQVNWIFKDSRGYMWFGTSSGLYRYDGYVFRNFQSDSQDGSSLPGSYILSIHEAMDGKLWVNTSGGLCVYNAQSESFERDMHQVYAKLGITEEPEFVYFDRNKNLWAKMRKKGILAYNMRQQLIYEFGFTDSNIGIPDGEIVAIGDCAEGGVIVYSDGTIACCSINDRQKTLWVNKQLSSILHSIPQTIRTYTDKLGRIWLYGQGLLAMFNSKSNTWTTNFPLAYEVNVNGTMNTINDIQDDRDGNIWVATDNYGLIRLDSKTLASTQVDVRNLNDKEDNDVTRNVLCVYVDDTNLLWVGTEKRGVAYYSKGIYKFNSLLMGDITAMAEDEDGNMYYGTDSKGIYNYPIDLSNYKITAMATTGEGSLWVGTARNGLIRILDGNVTVYSTMSDKGKTVIDNHINALCYDNNGALWIATNGGLQVYNTQRKNFSTYTKENGRIQTNTIMALHYTKRGNRLLVGTSEGLIILNLSTGEKQHLTGNVSHQKTFTNNYITQVYEDSRGLIWVGTREGVNILDLNSDNLLQLTEKNGLCSNCINGIIEDSHNGVWLSTTLGICRVVLQSDNADSYTYSLYNYDTKDGLQSNEFNRGSLIKRRDGQILFGGLHGVNWVALYGTKKKSFLPKVMLTQLFVEDTEILAGKDYQGHVILQDALNETSQINLENSENTFTIKFAGGNYNQSERLMFNYWMEGLDKVWRTGDALNHGVTFTNLPAGSYVLHVKAVNTLGEVSEHERTLIINVERPIYLAWWMILIYIVLIVVSLWFWKRGFDKVKMWRLRRRTILDELKRQREEIKSAGDDLRQPMAIIVTTITNMLESMTSMSQKEQVNTLHAQALQIITRLSEMQLVLENPETKAKKSADNLLELNEKGEVKLISVAGEELTSTVKPRNATTCQYTIVFIDDHKEALEFIVDRLSGIYNLYCYHSMKAALEDLDTLKPNIIVCKQNMPEMSGSELCNRIKTKDSTQSIKFVLVTDTVMSLHDMKENNITLSADDYMAKPYNLQEAMMRFNKLLGLSVHEAVSNLIEGEETRRLEQRNSSMTTSSVTMEELGGNSSEDNGMGVTVLRETDSEDPLKHLMGGDRGDEDGNWVDDNTHLEFYNGELIGDYTMSNTMDRQLLINVEQYVLHNMSRGHISIADMAEAMGMGRVPFFHKIRNITKRTPTELIRIIRLQHACTLLARTDLNMNELAKNIGFPTADNFSAAFKDKYGVTPIEYRMTSRM